MISSHKRVFKERAHLRIEPAHSKLQRLGTLVLQNMGGSSFPRYRTLSWEISHMTKYTDMYVHIHTHTKLALKMEHNYIWNLIFCLLALYFASTWSRSILVINAFYLYRGILHNESDGVISAQMTSLFKYRFYIYWTHTQQPRMLGWLLKN